MKKLLYFFFSVFKPGLDSSVCLEEELPEMVEDESSRKYRYKFIMQHMPNGYVSYKKLSFPLGLIPMGKKGKICINYAVKNVEKKVMTSVSGLDLLRILHQNTAFLKAMERIIFLEMNDDEANIPDEKCVQIIFYTGEGYACLTSKREVYFKIPLKSSPSYYSTLFLQVLEGPIPTVFPKGTIFLTIE